MIADTDIVVPSGGGTGPLTANALRVIYGERPSFVVRYHSTKQLSQTRFILETEIHRQAKIEAPLVETEAGEDPEIIAIGLDDEVQKKTRTEEAIGRACLLVAGAQTAHRELTYLADAFRWVLGQVSKFQTQILEEDMERLRHVQDALRHGTNATARHFDSVENPDFRRRLRDHACGFLAPLIQEMSIHWPSPLLRDSLELIDLPGIGILSDAYASVTSDYLRNRAKAVMLVTNDRGIRREDAELLKNSGFLNRLLFSSHDLATDPVALIVVVVRIDDVAVENWKNDKAVNGVALKTKVQHFADQVDRCRNDIAQRLHTFLREVWEDDTRRKGHMSSPLVIFERIPHVVIRQTDDWGIQVLDLASPPRRLWGSQPTIPSPVRTHIDPYQTQPCPLPAQLLTNPLTDGDTWSAMSKRSLARFEAFFLIAEDPQRRLDAREVVTLVQAFVGECVASLREQTAQLCEEMLQSISEGKTEGVHQKTLNRLVRFIDQFKAMNFANDTEMEAQLEKVRRELLSRTAAEYRDSTHAQRQLRQGLNALAGKARELMQADASEIVQRFGELGKRRFNLAA